MSTQLVFIDIRVANYETLTAALDPSAEIILLDAERDGLTQILAALQGRTDIDSVHIVSHGSEGALYLGSSVLDESTLDAYADELADIGASLSDTGDILLYG